MAATQRWDLARISDHLVPVALLAAGLLAGDPALWYEGFAWTFGAIVVPLMTMATLSHVLYLNSGVRIQGERKKKPPIPAEAFETVRAMFVVATMAAWPVYMELQGQPTGLVWTVEEAGGSIWLVILQMWAGIVAVDAWTYWKHRLLHTKLFFGFHRNHHAFRDPTPFAGFAISPVEAVLTFWPLLALVHPKAVHFGPFYFGAIVSFVVLNFYLHAGVTYRWAEAVLPKMMLNSSGHHNQHHANVNVNFGEVSFMWDRWCKTTKADIQAKKEAAREAKAAVSAG